jgi:hypothetical protein
VWGLIAIAGVCAGCASVMPVGTGAPATAAVPPSPPEDELLAFVVAASTGQSGVVQDPLRGRVRVHVDREYYSAEGIICRRFNVQPLTAQSAKTIETRAACQEPGGWRLTAIGSTGAIP